MTNNGIDLILAVTVVTFALFLAAFCYILGKQPSAAEGQPQLSLHSPKYWLQYAFLARYQLLLLIILIAFGLLATRPMRDLLGNLWILSTWGELAVVTWLAVLTAWVIFQTLYVLARAAPVRYDPLPRIQRPAGWLGWFFTWGGFYALAALPLIVTLGYASSDLKWRWRLAGIAGGLALALASAAIHYGLLKVSGPLVRLLKKGTARLPTSLVEDAFRGYRFEFGHGNVAFYLVINLIVYAIGYLYFQPDAMRWEFAPPALAYVLLLLILIGFTLPGMAFFLDRYRFPVGIAIVALSFALWLLGNSDNYYLLLAKAPVSPIPATVKLTPPLALERWEANHQQDKLPLVIVTASGGGIKAALWTTSVLQALQSWLGPEFASHIVLISSVSGGSVGALHYMDAWQANGPPSVDGLRQAVQAAANPSLSSATWGLIYPDLWQQIVGEPIRNRGWALEQAWRRPMISPTVTLEEWRTGIYSGTRPAIFFNATIVENGSLFIFTPLDELNATAKRKANEWHSRYFNTLYPTYTVAAATAARMSATFPYVSPISSPIFNGERLPTDGFHLADGGYFDNYGIVSALEWLEAVGNTPSIQRRKVILIRIEAARLQQDSLAQARSNIAWLYPLSGPAVGAVNSLFTAQKWRNDQAILQLTNKEQPLAAEDSVVNRLAQTYAKVRLEDFVFAFNESASLSWQLSQAERDRIQCAVDSPDNLSLARAVCEAFYATGSEQFAQCSKLPTLRTAKVLTDKQCGP